MPKKFDFTLTNEAIIELDDAIKRDAHHVVRERGKAIKQLHLGRKVPEVAEIFCVSQPTIYNWWKRYALLGIAGLANKVKVMPRRKVTERYLTLLEATLASEPQTHGYPFAIWTSERLPDHLYEQTGIHITLKWLNQVMAEAGFVYRRPKHTVSNKQDADAKQAARAAIEEMKKRPLTVKSGSSLWMKRP